jgi:integrase
MKLDAKTVAALDLGGKKDVIFFDAELAGFGHRLRVGSGGKLLRSWVVQYRRGGTSRRLLIGSGAVLSAEQARIAAKKVLARVQLGEDPQGDKLARRDKDKQTLASIMAEYLPVKACKVRPSSMREIRRYLTGRPYFGPLHTMAVDAVTRKDVAHRLVVITRENGSVAAARARAALSGFYTWAMQMGLTESNPTINVVKPSDSKSRERVLSNDEIAAIWRASHDDDYGRIVRLLILTGCRRAEIGGMRWSELDLEGGTFTIPASRSKNKRAHTLPLMPMMTAIIAGVPRRVSRDLLFGLRDPNGFGGWDHGKNELDARCGVQDWHLHDVRRSVATKMGDDLGTQPHIIEAILNHQSGFRRGDAGTYNRSPYEREVRAALVLWCDHVRALVAGERKVLPYVAVS